MADEPEVVVPTEATPPAKRRSSMGELVDRYGSAIVVSMLLFTFTEIAVLAPMIRYGVDIGPGLRWWHETTGFGEPDLGSVAPTWAASIVTAYVVTRGLKVVTVPMSIAITPFVRRVMDRLSAKR